VAVLTAVNCRGVEAGTRIQNTFTAAKIGALLALIALCLGVGASSEVVAIDFSSPWSRPPDAMPIGLAIGSAMVGALFSMDAWNNVTFTAEEVRAPERTIPRSLVAGTALVVTLYLAAIVGYLVVLPALGDPNGTTPLARGIAYATADRVATAAMEVILGPAGSVVMAAAIMVSTFGCANGMILSGARVSYAMARDGLFFARAGQLSARGAPVVALIVQGVWTAALTSSGTYGDLLDYVIFAALLFYAVTIAATLRFGRGGPVRRALAVAYITTAALVMLALLVAKPRFTWPGLLIVLTGVPIYYTRRHMQRRVS
jgi:APA family basic amino acid/polyamine antiporter